MNLFNHELRPLETFFSWIEEAVAGVGDEKMRFF
jgi:hypothetical protein